MLTGGDDPRYRSLVAANNQYVTRCEVWKSGTRVDPYGAAGVPLVSGSVSASLQNRVTRTASLSVDAALYPWARGDLLDPLESEIRLMAGLRGGGGEPFMFPVFHGVFNVEIDSREDTMSIIATDLAEPIIAKKFDMPYATLDGEFVTPHVMTLVRDSYPSILIGEFDETYATTGDLIWEDDKGMALDDLADLASCHWFLRGDGALMFRRIPWTDPTYDPASVVATFTPGSGLRWAKTGFSRDDLYNHVLISSMIGATDDVVYISVVDDDPKSRTYARGPLGYRTAVLTAPKAATNMQMTQMALDHMLRSKSRVVELEASLAIDPSLELGDICRLEAFGGREFDVALVGIRLPLVGTDATMETTWRGPGGVIDA